MDVSSVLNPDQILAIGGMMGGLYAVLMVASLALSILLIIARWKMFSKAGLGGWRALIPILNDYTSYKICWAGIAYWIWFLLGILSSMFLVMAYPLDQFASIKDADQLLRWLQAPTNLVFLIIGCAFAVIEIIWHIVKLWKTARVFGRGFGTFLGLLVLPTVFTLILGFGKAEYVGFDDEY